MDLELYFRVLWRFRRLVAVGLTLAAILSLLSFVKISFAGGTPRLGYSQTQTWQSEAVLFVTQRNFPWGRTTPQYQPASPSEGLPAVPTADANRLSTLAVLYAQLATTYQVQRLMRQLPAKPTDVTVAAIPAPPFSNPPILPLISVKARGTSPSGASRLASDQANAISRYVDLNQQGAKTPVLERVLVQEVQRPDRNPATLIGKRGKTLPVIVFLAVMIATLGLAFILENLGPGIRAVDSVAVGADDDLRRGSHRAREAAALSAEPTRRPADKTRRPA
jgi:hypothetical protein